MKIAFCVITEGDSKLDSLKGLVASVKDYVQSIHITANGKETKKLEKWCKENKYDYSFLKWNDNFAEQRNFNFGRAPKDVDFILWADSDDVVVGAEYLPEVARIAKKGENDVVFFTYWYGCKFRGKPSNETLEDIELSQMRERLIRPNTVVWKKRIHETPVPVEGARDNYTKVEYSEEYPIAWLHLGADRAMSQKDLMAKTARNQRLLELELEDERKEGGADPRTLLYLMKIYAESEDETFLRKCIEMGKEYMAKSGWDAERAICTSLMSKCHGILGEYGPAEDYLLVAIKNYPFDPLLYLYLARIYFNQQKFRAMRHWMNVAMNINVDESHTNFNNLLELKVLSTELNLQYFMYSDKKDARKAYKAAEALYKLVPTDNNKNNVDFLYDLKELDLASEEVHKLIKYYEDIDASDKIEQTINAMPEEMKKLPFAVSYFNKHSKPRVWGEKEICYYATFGREHFEKWSPASLKKGIGGSETAVIRLSQEWAKLGYKVTVYGDPGKEQGEIDGVTWLPYFKFNPKDKFNIFIQWRSNHLAGKISCKKFMVDLHDVWNEADFTSKMKSIDKIATKSNYHRNFGQNIPDEKFLIISNGI